MIIMAAITNDARIIPIAIIKNRNGVTLACTVSSVTWVRVLVVAGERLYFLTAIGIRRSVNTSSSSSLYSIRAGFLLCVSVVRRGVSSGCNPAWWPTLCFDDCRSGRCALKIFSAIIEYSSQPCNRYTPYVVLTLHQ